MTLECIYSFFNVTIYEVGIKLKTFEGGGVSWRPKYAILQVLFACFTGRILFIMDKMDKELDINVLPDVNLDNFESPIFENSKYIITSPRSLLACSRLDIKVTLRITKKTLVKPTLFRFNVYSLILVLYNIWSVFNSQLSCCTSHSKSIWKTWCLKMFRCVQFMTNTQKKRKNEKVNYFNHLLHYIVSI